VGPFVAVNLIGGKITGVEIYHPVAKSRGPNSNALAYAEHAFRPTIE